MDFTSRLAFDGLSLTNHCQVFAIAIFVDQLAIHFILMTATQLCFHLHLPHSHKLESCAVLWRRDVAVIDQFCLVGDKRGTLAIVRLSGQGSP